MRTCIVLMKPCHTARSCNGLRSFHGARWRYQSKRAKSLPCDHSRFSESYTVARRLKARCQMIFGALVRE